MGNRLAPASPETSRRNLLLNAMAGDAERESMRFMAFCADRLVLHLNPSAGDKILDAACGVGALTLAASQAVGPSGRVIAIDSADNMLASLDAKVRQFGIANIDMHSMDAAQLDFRRDYFQHSAAGRSVAATCRASGWQLQRESAVGASRFARCLAQSVGRRRLGRCACTFGTTRLPQ